MRRFIIQIFLVLAVPLIVVYVVSQLPTTDYLRFVSKITPDKEIVVLGTSHGFDFTSVSPQMAFLNFAKAGNTPYYDLQNFRWLHGQGIHKKEAIIIIPVSYFSFGIDENRTNNASSDGFVNDFYFYLNRDQVYDYSLRKEVSLRVFAFQEVLEKYTGLQKDFGGRFIVDPPNNYINPEHLTHEEHLKQDAKIRLENHLDGANYAPETPNYNYYSTLLNEAKSLGYRPVLATVPYSTFYQTGFDSLWLDTTYFQKLYQLSREQHVPYLNYSTYAPIATRPELYRDSDHLNSEGIEKFSTIFFEDLAEYYDLTGILEN